MGFEESEREASRSVSRTLGKEGAEGVESDDCEAVAGVAERERVFLCEWVSMRRIGGGC